MTTTSHPGATAGSSDADDPWEVARRASSVFATDDTGARRSAPAEPAVPALRPDSWRLVARRFPLWVLAVVANVAVASALGLLLKHTLDGSALVRFDERLAARLEDVRTSTWNTLSGIGNFFADPIPVAVLLLVAMIVARLVLRSWNAPLLLAAGVGGEKLSYYLTTLVVDRPRPEVETIGHRHVTSSFPSGHVGSAVSLYGCIAVIVWLALWQHHAARRAGALGRTERTPDRAVPLLAVVVALMGVIVAAARMYRGFHFLTDVVVGAAIGVVWVLIPLGLLVRRSGDDQAPAWRVSRSPATAMPVDNVR